MIIGNGLIQQLLIAPAAVNARAPIGMATPYASILLEARQGEVAFVPTAAFRAGLNPTAADLQRFYAANQRRYMVPEQRVLRIAKIGPEQVASVQPTDKEIADYYNANRAHLCGRRTPRIISQAVVPDQATAQRHRPAAPRRAGFAAAAAPAGFSAAGHFALGAQTREQFTSVAGATGRRRRLRRERRCGRRADPVRHRLARREDRRDPARGRQVARRSRGGDLREARRATSARRAIEDLVDQRPGRDRRRRELQRSGGGGQAHADVETPPITADGRSRTDADYRLPARACAGAEGRLRAGRE